MAISNLSTGLRPGVCTSTTRPTTPYEGQHIYETDTDIEYVWNGTAWVVNYVSAASPTFTGVPAAPTATAGTNTTQLATTAFVTTAIVNVAPQTTVYTSGSGTYTVPANTRWLSVKMVGGGGAGAAPDGTGAANGLAGSSTTFGTGSANGGGGGYVNDNGGAGGTATIVSGASGIAISGSDGGSNPSPVGTGRGDNQGGNGGSSVLGGAGGGNGGSNYANGKNGKANTGGGGGGAGGANALPAYAAGGGGAGGYVECIITSLAASYAYAVGAGGAGVSNGTVSGGNGGSGVIYVIAYF